MICFTKKHQGFFFDGNINVNHQNHSSYQSKASVTPGMNLKGCLLNGHPASCDSSHRSCQVSRKCWRVDPNNDAIACDPEAAWGGSFFSEKSWQIMAKHGINEIFSRNVLFYITAIFVAWVLTHGGCATVEHPQGRKASEGRFTIWFSAFLRRLQQHQECSTFTFYLGQVSLKPTTFLLVRLPMFPHVQRRLAVHKGPFRTLQGKKADGAGWGTSAAKEFPPALCLAIAQSVQAFCLAQSCTDEQSSLTWPDVPAQMWKLTTSLRGGKAGPQWAQIFGARSNTDLPCMVSRQRLRFVVVE